MEPERLRGAAGLSRKEKILRILQKHPDKKFTTQDIIERLGFNTDHNIVKMSMEQLIKDEKVESTKQGAITVYYAKLQSV